MKKNILGILSLFFLIFLPMVARGESNIVDAYFFRGEGCPHCAKEEAFFKNELTVEYPNLKIHDFEIYNDSHNAFLLEKVAKKLNVRVDGVPFLIIGDKPFVGFSEDLSPKMIRQRVQECATTACPDSVGAIVGNNSATGGQSGANSSSTVSDLSSLEFSIPLLGVVKASDFSLPALTAVIGLLDGFNPCAMWALIFLLSLLLGINDKKRVWILGSAFILTSAIVYFFFMSAWLNLILFIGFIFWIRVLIGVVAIGGGLYSLRDYFTKKDDNVCEIADGDRQQKFFDRLKKVVQQNNLWLALAGIVVLSASINLIEMVCSAGLPAVYTQVLALNNLATWQYYAYILFYIFFFILDDLIVFGLAITTLKIGGMSGKYSKFSRLAGGLIMLAIGAILILKPELLLFG